MTMHSSTARAVERLASGYDILKLEDVEVVLDDGYGERHECHRLDDGRWINASYNEQAEQWRSSDLRDAPQGWTYAFSRDLDRLARDVDTHASAPAALRRSIGRS